MYLSKSSLGTFLQCPRKFSYIYIDKQKTPTSPQAQRGINVHEFCRDFYDNITFKGKKNCIVKDGFLGDTLNVYSEETKECIENLIEFEFKRWEICKQLSPKDPKKLFLPLLRESKYFSEPLQQVTIVDRLDQRLDGNYTLDENKTTKDVEKARKKNRFRR